ncbi:amino acid permease-domain-containing protein [Armillaria novae-zelandiae]|uniref:Amino acid permease-domain-containing protein n=1 Tax=Armillaria novae-zelandiae TaxID=153914 RepID=A0AA39P7J7_9AGAR|nr:amino acid permease-domain-containing protein [Armillaria novae-zelandiae]
MNTREAVQRADEELLASLGYKQEFRRAFTPIEVFGIAFSIIGLLPSISSVLFYAIPNGGGPAMTWGWAVASVFILFVGMSMAELASAAPTSGGLYFWTHSLSSPRWRNLLSWIVGYMNTIGSIASVASIDWGCAVQVMAAARIGFERTRVSSLRMDSFCPGVYAAVVLSHAVVCCLGTTILARLQSAYVVLNILLCLAVIIALPIVTPAEFKNTARFALWEFVNLDGWPKGYAFILSFLAPLWTICSFDSSVHISEEAANAATAVPWAIVMAIAIAGVLGWAINVALAFCMGTDLQALYDSDQPMAQIFLNGFGQKGTLGIWAIVVLVQYMMGSSMLLAASRQTYAFSRDKALPLSDWLYRMNSFTGTPVNTVWFDAGWALVLGLLAFAGTEAIDAVFSISSLPVAIIAVSFMTFMSVVFMFPSTPVTSVQDMNYAVVVLGGIFILSLAWYYFPKYGGVHWFTGPVTTISDIPGIDSQGSTPEDLKKVKSRVHTELVLDDS